MGSTVKKRRAVVLGRGLSWLMAVLALAALAVACGGDESGSSPTEAPTTKSTVAPTAEASPSANLGAQIVTSMLTVGENRFSIGIFDEAAGGPLLDGDMSFRFFKVEAGQGTLRFESEAEFVGFDTFTISESQAQKVEGPPIGVYVANVEFDEPGDWGVEVNGAAGGQQVSQLRVAFKVFPRDQILSIGDAAPPSRQLTVDDVSDLSEIDTMQPPDPFHDITVADALETGQPVLVLLGTPAFCETRTCGPVMETTMLPLYEKYGDQAVFIHIEPYRLEELRSGVGYCPVPVFNRELARTGQGEGGGQCPAIPEQELPPPDESWNLTTEPVLFLVDREGKIAAVFEGIAGEQEVEAALQPLLEP